MSISYVASGNYSDLRFQILGALELQHNGKDYYPRDIGDGVITIGAGINMSGGSRTNKFAVYEALGIKVGLDGVVLRSSGTLDQQAIEQGYITKLNNAIQTVQHGTSSVDGAVAQLHSIMSQRAADNRLNGYADNRNPYFVFQPATADQQIRLSFDEAAKAYESELQRVLGSAIYDAPNFADSKEHAVLFSRMWLGGGISTELKRALSPSTGNRAEAWFQIRYGWHESNATKNNPNNGWAKRHFLESALFGLYDSSTTPYEVYRMLQEHRTTILKFEAKYGENPDGSSGARDMIAEGNRETSYQAALAAVGIAKIPAITDAFAPAENAIISSLQTRFSGEPEILSSLVATNFLSTNVFVASDKVSEAIKGDPSLASLFMGSNLFKDTLSGGTGADILISGAGGGELYGGSGNDTLVAGGGNVISDGGNVVLNGGVGNDTYIIGQKGTAEIIDSDAKGSIWASGKQLTGPGIAVGTQSGVNTIWTVGNLTYTFTPTNASKGIGYMQITGAGEPITIDNFDLSKAQTDPNGYLGLKITQKCKVKMGNGSLTTSQVICQSGSSIDPPPGAYNFTAYVSAISDQPQTVTLGLSGADPAGFAVDTGNGIIQFVNGQITLTIPAGRDSVTFGLINTTDVPTPETIQLTETLNGNTAVTDTLAVTYTASPAANTTQANYTIAGGYAPREFKSEIPAGTTTIDPTWLNPTYAVGSTHTDPDTGLVTVLSYIVSYNLKDAVGNLIPDMGKPTPNKNASLLGSSGNDQISTIANATYLDARQGGNDTIVGNQNNDYILAGDGNNIITGQGGKDVLTAGNGNNQIYANDKIDIVTALAQRQNAQSTNTQGDYIAVGNGNNTIVGGSGNDAILMGSGDNTVYCGPGNVTLMGRVSAQPPAVFYNKGRFKREAANDAEGRLAA